MFVYYIKTPLPIVKTTPQLWPNKILCMQAVRITDTVQAGCSYDMILEMKKKIIFLTFLMLPCYVAGQSFGRISTGNLSVEPIIGYERVQKISPTARTQNRFYYGVRASYGVPLLSAEAELTRSQDSESFPDQDLKLEETSTTLMLGLRSSFNHQGMLGAYLRAGGHARRSEIEKTQDGVKTIDEPAVRVSPYAGAGLNLRLAQYFRLNAGVTVVFTGEPKGDDRDYRTSLGFSINI